jgi:argininosuccinate lyase
MTMWDGRFSKKTARLMHEFNASLPVDIVLIEEDIAGSIAWARALAKARVLSKREALKIVAGLKRILKRARDGRLRFKEQDEDVHMAVERMLTDDIGAAGAKLHTGRSRNDQVATDVRMYVKNMLAVLHETLYDMQRVLIKRAEKDIEIIAAGYTHLQQAQPISLAHYWLSLFFALEREKERVAKAADTADALPLGAGAIAGSGFKVNRKALARELGFSRVCDNSIDAVSSRDFVLEALAAVSSAGILLSRYSEDLIIWSSKEFGFIELDDAWSTGSSMMPQKKNPDSLELIRGKCARFIGNYTRCATMLKGVGLAYYKDLQEDKEPLFDSLQQIVTVAEVFGRIIKTLSVKKQRIAQNLDSFLFATDVADYLVKKKVPFRKAHKITGAIVADCIRNGRSLGDYTSKELKSFSVEFGSDAGRIFNWKRSLAARNIDGGTGMKSIDAQMRKAKHMIGIK